MKSAKYALLVFMLVLSSLGSLRQVEAQSPSANLRTWYYVDMWGERTGSYYLSNGVKGAQGFKPFKDCTIFKLSIYIDSYAPVVYVELRSDSPDGPLLAQGSVSGYGWLDISFSDISVSVSRWYYAVAWDAPKEKEKKKNSFDWYYKADGSSDDEGPAYVNEGWGWQLQNWDFLVRYYAKFTVDSSRVQHLQALASTYKPVIQYEIGRDDDVSTEASATNYYTISPWGYSKAAQAFRPIQDCSCDSVGIYANKVYGEDVQVNVEIRSGSVGGTLVASTTISVNGTVGYPGWYYGYFSAVILSKNVQYYLIVIPTNDIHFYYGFESDGDDGPAKLYSGTWQDLSGKDFAVKYGEHWQACDFYYDHDINIGSNPDNWPVRKPTYHADWDPNYRVFIHVEEYAFYDQRALGPMIAIEYWYYYVYNTYPEVPWPPHNHDWELHSVVFLAQSSEIPVLIGVARHNEILYYDWTDSRVHKEDTSHPRIYVNSGSHAAYVDPIVFRWPDTWIGDGVKIGYGSFLNVFVLHTAPCRDHYENYCNIVKDLDWQGNHFYWDWEETPNSRDWWPTWWGEVGPPPLPGVRWAPWHRYTWDEPTTGNPSA